MKQLQSSFIRALCAIVVGALLVKYRSDMVTWMTIAIGVLFFLSGIVSCAVYFVGRRRASDIEVYDAEGRPVVASRQLMFPIVGAGSIILGAILAFMPNTFANGLVYVLSALLILGAIGQFVSLASILKYSRVGFFWWVVPSLLLILGIVAIVRPQTIAAAPLFVIGWAMMVYGVVELVNAIKIYRVLRPLQKAAAAKELAQQNAAEEAVEVTEEADPTVPAFEDPVAPHDDAAEVVDLNSEPEL